MHVSPQHCPPNRRKAISIVFTLLFFSVIAADTHADDWGPATNNAQMSIQLYGDEHSIASNQPVVLQMRFRNVSTNKGFYFISEVDTERDPGFSFLINSPSGKNISIHGTTNQPYFGSGRLINVGTNQIRELEFNLSRLCTFDEFGTYNIAATRSIITGMISNEMSNARPLTPNSKPIKILTGCWLTSNPLNITIVPDK
jgi:hypothetical protein